MDLRRRAAAYAALGDLDRLRIVTMLWLGDHSPRDLAARCGISPSLLAHHLDVLEDASIVRRLASRADGRRRFVTLRRGTAAALGVGSVVPPAPRRVLFVCTHNSARSQLAVAVWRGLTGLDATSAGTAPADAVHPLATSTARRHGLRLGGIPPRHLRQAPTAGRTVVTVCDDAHEQVGRANGWLHWSIPDPAAVGTRAAFDTTVAELRERISPLTTRKELSP
jgi:protein-tyrosine-phosphatase/DNA-binding transcriptional ArsR family regulator